MSGGFFRCDVADAEAKRKAVLLSLGPFRFLYTANAIAPMLV